MKYYNPNFLMLGRCCFPERKTDRPIIKVYSRRGRMGKEGAREWWAGCQAQ